MIKNDYIVYAHKNKINNKIYIGQTGMKPERRWNKGEGYKTSTYFYSAIQKYGWNNFKHIILKENLNLEQANYWEKYYIKLYNSNNSKYGYNLNSGGRNFKISQQTKIKMSKSHLGKKKSKQMKEKLRQINLGKKMSEESKKKMSKNHADVSGSKNPMYGRHHTDESKTKIGAIKVYCIELDMTFNSYTDAAKYVGLKSRQSIANYFIGRAKSAGKHPITKKPLHWKQVEV